LTKFDIYVDNIFLNYVRTAVYTSTDTSMVLVQNTGVHPVTGMWKESDINYYRLKNKDYFVFLLHYSPNKA